MALDAAVCNHEKLLQPLTINCLEETKMPAKSSSNTKPTLKDSSVPLSLQALQSGIDSLSLDEALAAVKLAKLKIDDLRELQNKAHSQVISASIDVKEAELRLDSLDCSYK